MLQVLVAQEAGDGADGDDGGNGREDHQNADDVEGCEDFTKDKYTADKGGDRL